MYWLYIFIGGGIGSLLRYAISLISFRVLTVTFPIATLISNSLACLILGVIVYAFSGKTIQYEWVQPLLVIGLCGGFSTFSTFSNETVQLFTSGNALMAILNILISLASGIGIIYVFQNTVKYTKRPVSLGEFPRSTKLF